jgi:hypothetical protein
VVRAYALQLKEYEPAIRRTTDLFMRVSTKEAELVATIRFAHADIVRGGLAKPSERDVLREVMELEDRSGKRS